MYIIGLLFGMNSIKKTEKNITSRQTFSRVKLILKSQIALSLIKIFTINAFFPLSLIEQKPRTSLNDF